MLLLHVFAPEVSASMLMLAGTVVRCCCLCNRVSSRTAEWGSVWMMECVCNSAGIALCDVSSFDDGDDDTEYTTAVAVVTA